MEKETVQYKRTLKGSVGAGVNALFNGSGRRYFILEHKDASRLHRAGESQKFIIDQVELGRDKNCQVQFGEDMITVSRRHAAIIREGDRWKLIQLSKTNSTFLNGRPIESQWYLENGDEIQLSVGGPRMGFIVPEGKQSLVSSIKMTERLELFRKQALKPYKKAIACLASLLVLAVGGLTTWNVIEHNAWEEKYAQAKQELAKNDSINNENFAKLQSNIDATTELLEETKKRNIELNGRLHDLNEKFKNTIENSTVGGDWMDACNPYVFFLEVNKIEITWRGGTKEELSTKEYGWCGTGFLLDDGRFITAKHCIVGWQFNPGLVYDEEISDYKCTDSYGWLNFWVNNLASDIEVEYIAYSIAGSFTFTNKQVVMSNQNDEIGTLLESCTGMKAHLSPLDYTDWAYIRTNAKGGLTANNTWSLSPEIGQELMVLGYPKGYLPEDTKPLPGSCKVAHDGLDYNLITVTERNFESGNSGGPAIRINNGKPEVVGLVSGGIGETVGFIVPIGVVL